MKTWTTMMCVTCRTALLAMALAVGLGLGCDKKANPPRQTSQASGTRRDAEGDLRRRRAERLSEFG
jgi:hypothetical protein